LQSNSLIVCVNRRIELQNHGCHIWRTWESVIWNYAALNQFINTLPTMYYVVVTLYFNIVLRRVKNISVVMKILADLLLCWLTFKSSKYNVPHSDIYCKLLPNRQVVRKEVQPTLCWVWNNLCPKINKNIAVLSFSQQLYSCALQYSPFTVIWILWYIMMCFSCSTK
jgi:hypothetical protein